MRLGSEKKNWLLRITWNGYSIWKDLITKQHWEQVQNQTGSNCDPCCLKHAFNFSLRFICNYQLISESVTGHCCSIKMQCSCKITSSLPIALSAQPWDLQRNNEKFRDQGLVTVTSPVCVSSLLSVTMSRRDHSYHPSLATMPEEQSFIEEPPTEPSSLSHRVVPPRDLSSAASSRSGPPTRDLHSAASVYKTVSEWVPRVSCQWKISMGQCKKDVTPVR